MQTKLKQYLTGIVSKIKEHPKLAISMSVLSLLVYTIRKQQRRMIYLPQIEGVPKSPSKNPLEYQNPGEYKLANFTNIQIKTKSSVVLRGWYISSAFKQPRQLLLYFHENAGNIGYRLPYIKHIIEKTNSDVMIVAYRGYSDSDGKPSQKGIKQDGICILKRAMQESRQRQLPLIVLGRSLGGAVAIHSCSQPEYLRQIKGLILQNTFTSIHDVAIHLFGGLLTKGLTRLLLLVLLSNKWESEKEISKIVAPTLFIKSAMDELIPMELMDKLQKKSMSRHESYTIRNGTHNQTWSLNPNEYFARVNKFISSL